MRAAVLASLAMLVACGGGSSAPELTLQPYGTTLSVTAGATAKITVTVTASEAATVTLTLAGAPAGVTLAPQLVTLGAGSKQVELTFTAAANVPAGSYPITVTGRLGEVSASASLTLKVVAATGSLVVAVTVPAGVTLTPVVRVVDGGGATVKTVGTVGDTTIADLPVGTYTLAADAVVVGGKTYTPTLVGSPVSVHAGEAAHASVAYAASVGSLNVVVTAPSGVTPDVTVKSGTTVVQAVHATGMTSISDLAPGTYTVEATAVVKGNVTYTPSVTGSPATVTVGQATTVTVTYAEPGTGALSVTVTAPSGITPSVTVKRGDTLIRTVAATGTTVIADLEPGSYLIAAADVATTHAVVTGSPATVRAGETAQASVAYQGPQTGALHVVVTAPAGVTPRVDVKNGAGTIVATLDEAGDRTLADLPAGAYTLVASVVHDGGVTYVAAVTGSPATIGGGATAEAAVTYTATTGVLVVSVNALATVTPQVTVKNPAGDVIRTLTAAGSVAFEDLAPGSYTIVAEAAVGSDGFTYLPVMGGSTVVVAGETTRATASYGVATGALSIAITAPPGVAPRALVRDGDGLVIQAISKPGTEVLTDLAVGSYTLEAVAQLQGRYTYAPAVATVHVTVEAGATATATLDYVAVTGALSVVRLAPPEITPVVTYRLLGDPPELLPPDGLARDLPPGSYLVSAPVRLGSDGYLYGPVQETTIEVTAGATSEWSVSYAPISGSIEVEVQSPGDALPIVNIHAPGGALVGLLQSAGTLVQALLTQGSFTIVAETVTGSHYTYVGTVTTSPVAVINGATSHADVSYAASDGAVEVEVIAPDGVTLTPSVRLLDGDDALVRTVAVVGQSVLGSVAAGSYSVQASPVGAGGKRYDPTVSGSPLTVELGTTDEVTVTYAPGPALEVDKTAVELLAVDATAELVWSEADYDGELSEMDDCEGVATVSSPSPGTFKVTAIAAGTCEVKVTDDYGQSVSATVRVTLVVIEID